MGYWEWKKMKKNKKHTLGKFKTSFLSTSETIHKWKGRLFNGKIFYVEPN